MTWLTSRTRLLAGALIAAATLALCLPSAAFAMVEAMTTDQLAARADAVVIAKVDANRARRLGSAGMRAPIVTDTRVRVLRVLKGSRPSAITITQPGGTVGGTTLHVSDIASFAPGEQCVLYLDASNRVIGGWQGKVPLGANLPRVAAYAPRSEGAPAKTADTTVRGSVVSQATTPSISSITPSKARGGTGDTVSINGSGFLAVRGTGKVYFTNGDKMVSTSDLEAAAYTLWTNTRIIVTVPRGVCSGDVVVVNNDGVTSAGYYYDSSFTLLGRKWGALPVTYRINQNTPDVIGEGTQIQSAFTTWNLAGSKFRVFNAGFSSETTNPPVANGQNDVYFATGNFPAGVLAWAYGWDVGGLYTECDLVFNDDYTWGTSASSGVVDVQTVALHELGHSVGLGDQYPNSWRAMGAYFGTLRTLFTDDAAGAVYLYGVETSGTGDIYPPTTSSDASSTWIGRDCTVTITATDNAGGSGVVSTEYRIDGSPPAPYVSPLPFSAEGTTTLEYWSTDASGNIEAAVTALVRIDKSPPVTTDDHTPIHVGGATIHLSPTDAYSGTAATFWSLDGGATQLGTTVSTLVEGVHTLTYWSVDAVGNVESPVTVTFEIQPRAKTYTVVAGSDRYATAVEASTRSYPSGASNVVIATGRNWADALGASALAGTVHGPLLLVAGDSVPQVTVNELKRLGATKAYIVGGTGAVSSDAAARVKDIVGSAERVAGANRYDTALRIAERVHELKGNAWDGAVFVATGANFPDALGAAPLAANRGWPILLTRSTGDVLLPAGTTRVYLLGGTSVISGATERQLRNDFGGNCVRLAGSNRYGTAAAVAVLGATEGLSFIEVGIASGESFPDALAGGVMLGKEGAIMLLTPRDSLAPEASAQLKANRVVIGPVVFIGGESALSPAVIDAVRAVLK